MQPPGSPAAAPPRPSTRWQKALAASSLATLSLLVILPAVFLLLLLWGAVLALAAAGPLDAIGALHRRAFEGAVALAALSLGLTGLAALIGKGLARLPARRRTPAPPPAPGAVPFPAPAPSRLTVPWVLRRPWLTATGAIVIIEGCGLPLDLSRAVDVPAEVLGAGILAGAGLLLLVVAYGLLRACWLVLRGLWNVSKQSPFFAGAVTAGSLIATTGAYFLAYAFIAAIAALPMPEASAAAPACARPGLDCSREILQVAGAGARGGRGAGAPGFPDAPPSFARCVEELHRPGLDRRSARDEALATAWLITRDQAISEDVVHATLVAVCLGSERIAEVRPYFIRSVTYAARREAKRSRRYCPLVPEEPGWPPESCVDTSLLAGYIHAEMEASASAALCNLSAEERRVIELHLWENLSHAEIARRLRVSVDAARQRYHRALVALRDEFHKQCR